MEKIVSTLFFELFYYFAFAGTTYLIFYVLFQKAIKSRIIQKKFEKRERIWEEIKYSISTIFVFTAVFSIVHHLQENGYTRHYDKVSEYGIPYIFISAALMVLMHDAYFYWLHKLMHHPLIFKRVHVIHHRSTNPSPWAAYYFHPIEAFGHIAILFFIVFLIPYHQVSIMMWWTYMLYFNIMGHLSVELFPAKFLDWGILKWHNSVVHHNMHHKYFNCNYGLYFNVWDRIMKTVHSKYYETFKEVTSEKLNLKNFINCIQENPHYQTIRPFLKRKPTSLPFEFERKITRDDDFLDLYWYKNSSKKLVIITHGLEGHAKQPYMLGMANAFSLDSHDIMLWNMRGCSKDLNRQRPLYHGGVIDDLHEVVTHALDTGDYDSITLIGFSLGGNIVLRYLGSERLSIPKEITIGIGISAPCDLKASTEKLDRNFNKIYSKYFLKEMKNKLIRKSKRYNINYDYPLQKIKTLSEFNYKVTAEIHGFLDGDDYYNKCSSVNFLQNIKVPTLILNALDDPFLEGDCYPYKEVSKNSFITLNTPSYGGHIGFYDYQNDSYFSEEISIEYVRGIINNEHLNIIPKPHQDQSLVDSKGGEA